MDAAQCLCVTSESLLNHNAKILNSNLPSHYSYGFLTVSPMFS